MSRPASYKPVVWIRRLLLVALIAFLGIVTGLLLKGREPAGDAGDDDARGGQEAVRDLTGGATDDLRTGKGFSHEVTEAGEPRYRISASSWSSTREEMVKLDDVEVLFDRGNGDQYAVKAKSGFYQQATATATLLGDVLIRGSNGLQIKGPGFELKRKGTLIVSTDGPVRFRYQDRFAGTAREVSSNLRKKSTELVGGVRIWSLAGEAVDASLTARRLTFEQEEQMIHAEGGVTMRRDGQELSARRLSIELDEGGKQPRFVRARWEVTGSRSQVDEGVPQTLRFSANELSVLFEPGTGSPQKAELEGKPSAPAVLEMAHAGGEVRRLTTPYLVAEFAAGAIASADAIGPVDLTDYLAFDPATPLSSGCADSAEARFKRGGELASMLLDGGVEFNQADFQVSGDSLEAKGESQLVVSGNPARVYSRRGEFEAPEILYRPDKGSGRAIGGVRATLSGDSGVDLMAQGDDVDEPVNVTATAAEWSDAAGSATFQGNVRAWQDENYLVASELEVGSSGQSLTATGQVRTVINQTREVGQPEPDTTAPLQVTAGMMEYDGAAGTLHYTGTPKARQAGRTLSCTDLDLKLDDDSEVEEMLCSGNAMIENPQEGQTVQGNEALYRPGSESVIVSGTPVILRNADGRQVTGARVVYDFATGAARILTSDSPVEGEGGVPGNADAPAENPSDGEGEPAP